MGVRLLTTKQEAFCRLCAFPDEHGRQLPLYRAYQHAYQNNCGRGAASEEASRLMSDDRIIARIGEYRIEASRVYAEQAASAGIAVKARRVLRKNRDWERIAQIFDARAAEPSTVPGHDTGLLVNVPRQIAGERVDVFQLDKPALDALNDLEESAARELGQRHAGTEITVNGGQVVFYLPENHREETA